MLRRNVSLFCICLVISSGVTTLVSAADPATAADGPGLGGSTSLTRDTVLPFSPGVRSRYERSVFLQNSGSVPLSIGLSTNLPLGITATPQVKMPFRLNVGETIDVPVVIASDDALIAGDYDGLISFNSSIIGPLPPGTTFLPGFGASFRIRAVGGDAANVTVQAINSNNGQPAFGVISLYYKNPDGGTTLLQSEENSQISRRIPAGSYVANFSIQGLVSRDEEFEVVAGEEKTVTIRIEGVNILAVSALPRGGSRNVSAAQLAIVVSNNLRRFDGPITIDVAVKRNDKLVENFRIAQLAEFPEGVIEQQSTYVPDDGFKKGRWTFEFSVTTSEYTVRAAQVPFINVSGGFGSWRMWIILLLILGGGSWYLYLVWRRRRDEEE